MSTSHWYTPYRPLVRCVPMAGSTSIPYRKNTDKADESGQEVTLSAGNKHQSGFMND
ncbi:hypothetical protein [Bacteroides heparinolyticus]|uniref:hypothetical protein n=1 Tax=Prevotella heparinolytica TaxID=28113 RepID=UPI0035A1CB5E